MPQGYMTKSVDHCHVAPGTEVITDCLVSICRAELSLWPCFLLSLAPRRYEVEINRRTTAENEFVMLKKVRGAGRLEEA